MSPADGTGPHPDVEELDLLAAAPEPPAGDQEPPAAHDPHRDPVTARAARHVRGCASCRQQVAALRRVHSLLRQEADRAEPVPPDVARRVDEALQREGRRRPAPAGGAHSGADRARPAAAATVLPGRSQEPRAPGTRVPRWLAAAAGLVVLGGAALAAADLLSPGGGDTVAGQSATGRPGTDGAAAEAAEPLPVVATGTDYAAPELDRQVAELLGSVAAGTTPPPGTPQSGRAGGQPDTERDAPALARPGDDTARLAARDALAGCLDALGVPGAAPLAVDLATWQGRPAAAIVLPPQHDTDADRLQVWVVGPRCGPQGDELLHFERVAPTP